MPIHDGAREDHGRPPTGAVPILCEAEARKRARERVRTRESGAGKAKPEKQSRKAKLGRERPERPGDLGGCPLGLIAGPWEGNI